MIVTCPSCSARFRVADDAIGGEGRLVRCGRCAYSWHQMPVPEQPPPLELSEPLPEKPPLAPSKVQSEADLRSEVRRREEERTFRAQRERRGGGGFLGWLLFLIVLGGLAAAGWYWRSEVVAAVPESARIYRWLGIEVSMPDEGRLELVNYTFMRRLVDSERKLVVAGEVVNRASQTLKVPTLRASVFDASGNELLHWDFNADTTELAPEASTRFESQHEHPDYGGEIDVEVRFLTTQQ